jgi:hypothetical protein
MAVRILYASGIEGNRIDLIFENSRALVEKAIKKD